VWVDMKYRETLWKSDPLFKTALQKLKPEDVLALKNVASTLLLIGILPSFKKW